MLLGGLVLAYGMVILAPLVPTAAWSGVIDSVAMGQPKGPQFPGRSSNTAMTLYIRGQPSGRTFSLPATSKLTGESIRSGDTVRASVGWATFREMPAAVHLVNSGTSLIDSAVVLREQRTQRSRVSLAGGVVLLLGLVGMLRSARKQ